ncbi:hypothetical protein [Roseimarinus sediminis]|jgi:uncharacterized membrane protein YdbT with pleckstrin-like domain|uniref:hypothetical protein n=1 Tax=Roseimarinus sediminis TaxID=1610899 RepID=UPI003D19FC8B
MKPIVIQNHHIKRELIIALLALIVSIGLNIYAIIHFETNWNELYTQIGYILVIALVFYLIQLLIRGIVFFLNRLFTSI